jgi:inositol transport system permease protein
VVENVKSVITKNNKSFTVINFLKNYGNVLMLVLTAIIMIFLNPRFLSLRNILNLSKQIVPTGIMALGAMFVIISGGIDLSAGYGVSLIAVVLGIVYLNTNSILLAIIFSLITGILMGVLNGVIITKLKMLPFITTLATMSLFQGLAYIFLFGKMAWVRHPFTTFLGNGNIFGIPFPFIFLGIIYFIGYLMLNHFKLGIYTIAIGNNEEGAIFAGINVDKYKFYLYILSGILTSICAILLISRLQMTTPTIGGISILLDAVAATIIGGTSLTGGKGSVRGTFIGVIIITLIGNILNLLNIDPNYRDVFKGLVIITVLFFDRAVNAKEYSKLS